MWHRRQEEDDVVIFFKGKDKLTAEIRVAINIKDKSIQYILNDRPITISELYDIVSLTHNVN